MSAARSRRANDKHNHLQRTPILVMGCSLLIACCIAFGGTNWTASAQPSEDQLPEQNAIVEPGYYQETIGSYEAISQSDDDERAENLRLAAEAINGYVIEPGATFSFNEVVGDTTAERGYKEAPVLYVSMETNESILTRSIVGLDERKVLGKMSSLRVDYDTQAVSHYIVMNASTNNAIALPFENAIAVGDTFITVQSYGSFVDANSPASKELVSDSNKLVGVEVYSRTGNTLGTVTTFDFDPVFGAIKSITLDNGSEFKSDAFLFFAPDFVFVDDGSKTAADLRQAEDNTSDAPAAAPASTPATQPAPAAQPAAPAANADGLSNEDALLVDFLIGKTLNDDVANADDTFALPKGTEITREIALDAKKHDALLLLTMSVD